jgi:hypothetical protein
LQTAFASCRDYMQQDKGSNYSKQISQAYKTVETPC